MDEEADTEETEVEEATVEETEIEKTVVEETGVKMEVEEVAVEDPNTPIISCLSIEKYVSVSVTRKTLMRRMTSTRTLTGVAEPSRKRRAEAHRISAR